MAILTVECCFCEAAGHSTALQRYDDPDCDSVLDFIVLETTKVCYFVMVMTNFAVDFLMFASFNFM